MTRRESLTWAVERLRMAGVPEPEADAWVLFSECFGMNRATYFLRRDEETTEGPEAERFEEWVKHREKRIPLQQITGHQEFMGLDFGVNEHVLIPRQDTEVLVETVLGDMRDGVSRREHHWVSGTEWSRENDKSDGSKLLRVLDMCAGSGCIGISIERLAPVRVSVLGVDISDEALKVAKANGVRLGCVHYDAVKSDLFEQIDGKYEVIVSNPPYIPTEVIRSLETEVKDHEPMLALDGEADGLAFYRRIIEAAPEYLVENGRIYVEIGYDQGESVSELFRQSGFGEIRVIRDLAGLDRVVTAVWPCRQ